MSDMKNIDKTRPVKVRIPSWLPEIETIVVGTKLGSDRMRVMIHQFFLAWVKSERIRKNDPSSGEYKLPGYFPVNAELLKEIGSKHYARYVMVLEEQGIIKRYRNTNGNGCYEVGKHSTLFTWIKPEGLQGQIPFRLEQVHNSLVIKSVLRTRDRHIKDRLRIPASIPPEHTAVFEQLRQYTNEVVFLPESEHQVSSDVDELFEHEVIHGNITWHTVCSFGNRYHNQLTTLSKKSRKRLRFAGHENTGLMVLDFSNSQPYFSSIIGCGKLVEELLPEFLPVLPILNRVERKTDYHLYRSLCAEGRLYEFFMEEHRMERDEVKKKLFQAVLFAEKKVSGFDKLFERSFETSFPSVLKMVKEIRRMDQYSLPRLKDIIRPPGVKFKSAHSNHSHKLIPAMMQRAESRIVYRFIVPALFAAGLYPLLTVHDSFILPQSRKGEEVARKIISAAFERFDVPPPHVKCEFL
jgi:hypothetical protein